MAANPPGYNRSYYLAHKAKIAEQHRLWYLKNKSYVITKQVIYNRKARKAKRAARAGQKPVRKSVRKLSPADNDGTRDTSPISGAEIVNIGEHGNALPSLPQSDTLSSVEPLDNGFFDPATGVVYKPIFPSLK